MTEQPLQPKLTLYRGWPTQGEHVWSPFVIKLEARLRFAGVSYNTAAGSPKAAPKGKIPYVELPLSDNPADGTTKIGDSTLIIQHLVEMDAIPDLNLQLSPEDKVRDLAMRALLEDKLYFFHTRERWMENYYTMRDHALSALPWPVRVLVGQLVYRNTRATLHGQGTLRLTKDEVLASKREIWQAISDALVSARARSERTCSAAGEDTDVSMPSSGVKPINMKPFWFLGGSEPTEADGTLFGFIVSVVLSTAAPESRDIVKGHPVLFDYTKRIHDSYFPDYQNGKL